APRLVDYVLALIDAHLDTLTEVLCDDDSLLGRSLRFDPQLRAATAALTTETRDGPHTLSTFRQDGSVAEDEAADGPRQPAQSADTQSFRYRLGEGSSVGLRPSQRVVGLEG